MFTHKRKLVLLMATMMLIGTLTIHALTSRTSNYSNSRDSSYFDYDSIFKELRSKPEGNHGFSMMNTSSNPLDGCYHVYLDVGTNVGIQIRKLYQPELYPSAKSHPLFESYFKRSKETLSGICTVGFEPNPSHTKRLQALEVAYNRCGWKVWILRETAVADSEGTSNFFSDNDFGNLEWGGTIIDPSSKQYGHIKDGAHNGHKVRLIRLSSYINDKVATRKIPNLDVGTFGEPKVLMKMDIEGSEVEVLPDLIHQKSLFNLDGLMVEYHVAIAKESQRKEATGMIKTLVDDYVKFNNLVHKHQIESVELDDESFYLSHEPLPQCQK
eukprot:07532.XXX_213420_215456_1 [CDS] Oithona nana genome sequencing.